MSFHSPSSDSLIVEKLQHSLNVSVQELLEAHTALEQAQTVVAAYEHVQQFEALQEATSDARDFFSALETDRCAVLARVRLYEKSCQDRVLQRLAIQQRRLYALHDSVASRTDFARRLPSELVGQIFIYATQKDDYCQLLNVCRISSVWRAIALTTPSLWNRLSIDACKTSRGETSAENNEKGPQFDPSLIGDQRPSLKPAPVLHKICRPDAARIWFARAGSLSLHVNLLWRPSLLTRPEWMDLFFSLTDRLESFVYTNFEEPQFADFVYRDAPISKMPQSFARLRVLKLIGGRFTYGVHPTPSEFVQYHLDMPNLESIAYLQYAFMPSSVIDWSTLPNVHSLSTSEYGFMSLLLDARRSTVLPLVNHLRCLSLEISKAAADFHGVALQNSKHSLTSFPALKNLHISDQGGVPHADEYTAALLGAISTPNLHTLTWTDTSLGSTSSPEHINAILGTPFLPRCPTLVVLDLHRINFSGDEHTAVFRAVPNLSTLRLRRMQPLLILRALSRKDETVSISLISGEVLLPNLRELTLQDIVDERKDIEPDEDSEGEGKSRVDPIEAFIRFRGLVYMSMEYPPRTDGQCVPMECVSVDGSQWSGLSGKRSRNVEKSQREL